MCLVRAMAEVQSDPRIRLSFISSPSERNDRLSFASELDSWSLVIVKKSLLAQYVRTLKSATLCKLGARAWAPPRRRRGETRALKLDDAISILPNRETDYAFHNIDRSYRRLCFKSCRNFAVKTNRMENRWNFHRK